MKNWLAELNLIYMVPRFSNSLYEAAALYDPRRYCFTWHIYCVWCYFKVIVYGFWEFQLWSVHLCHLRVREFPPKLRGLLFFCVWNLFMFGRAYNVELLLCNRVWDASFTPKGNTMDVWGFNEKNVISTFNFFSFLFCLVTLQLYVKCQWNVRN